MKTILWIQSEDTLGNDTFVIDGVVSESNDSPEQQEAFSELTKASQNVRLSPKNRREYHNKLGSSLQTNIANDNNTYYLQGVFEEKDERGRNIPFMFLIYECPSLEYAINQLTEIASDLNYHFRNADLDLLNRFVEKWGRPSGHTLSEIIKNFTFPISIIIIIIVIIWILKN